MSAAGRIRLWRLERRLQSLQRQYYGAASPENDLVAEYFRTLDETRALYMEGRRRQYDQRVHLGSGEHPLNGWINVDRDPAMAVDLAADLRAGLPFRSASVDLIHSEEFIEHFPLDQGKAIVRECHRVLRRGGVMRLLTPDLRTLVEEVYVRREPRHLRWARIYLEAGGPCEALNMHLRMAGEHRFIYDEERLSALLRESGFAVRKVGFNWSPVAELRYLDLRNFGLTLFLEAVKQ